MQVYEHIKQILKYSEIKIMPLVGGMALPKQKRLLSKKPHIVVATPGRLWDLISTGEEHLANMGHLRFLVLDEADRMMETGHFKELSLLLHYINNYGYLKFFVLFLL